MTQYLMSVWHDREATPEDIYPTVQEREPAYAATGAFSEAKEQLGGFWVVEAADLDAALELAARGSRACRGRVEVRPFQGE